MDPIGSILKAVLPYVLIGGTVLTAGIWAYYHVKAEGELAQATKDQPVITQALTQTASTEASGALTTTASGVAQGVTTTEHSIDQIVAQALAGLTAPRVKPIPYSQAPAPKEGQEGTPDTPFSASEVAAWLAAIISVRNCAGRGSHGDSLMCNPGAPAH